MKTMYAIRNSIGCCLSEEVEEDGSSSWGTVQEAEQFESPSAALQAAFVLGRRYQEQFGQTRAFNIELVQLEEQQRLVVALVL